MKVDLTPVIEPSNFTFDHVFDDNADNQIVYEMTTKPLLKTVKEGGNAVVFAFGQTGSGKTYTMLGAGTTGQKLACMPRPLRTCLPCFKVNCTLSSASTRCTGQSVSIFSTTVMRFREGKRHDGHRQEDKEGGAPAP